MLLDASLPTTYQVPAAFLLLGAMLTLPFVSDGRTAATHAARLMLGICCTSLIAAAVVTFAGAMQFDVFTFAGSRFGFRFDALSALMFVLVSFLALVVARYSVNYLSGDPGQASFSRRLTATSLSVLLLVLSSNLLMFAFFWVSTSLCLHQLLTFYRDRPAAVLAARKKFLISRVGDLCVLGAAVLVWQVFGTWDFDAIFTRAAELQGAPQMPWICGLLVGGALMKSAQFPFHSWLPETLETPTPVSALMHAGIINAGGFLVVRMAPLIVQCPGALNALALVGAFTALFASLVMMTQTSIKKSLAWSTVAQMGFMMLQCGLGAFALAVMHIVAHSLYKAHAFLGSGSIVEITKSAWTPVGRPAAHPGVVAASLLAALSVGWLTALLFGWQLFAEPGRLLLTAVFVMALAHLLWTLWSSSMRKKLLLPGLLMTLGAVAACFALHAGFEHLLSGVVPTYQPVRTALEYAVMSVVALLFLGVLVFQSQLPLWSAHPAVARFYVHASNGFYLGTHFARLIRRPLA